MRKKPNSSDFLLTEILHSAEETARKAFKHRHPLIGGGFYATKFSGAHAAATVALSELSSKCKELDDLKVTDSLAAIDGLLVRFFDPAAKNSDRSLWKQQIAFQLKTVVQPALASASSHAPSDKFFPLELVANTRPYIEKVAHQACGCYDMQWYDAASVMARRLLETLIIELYESRHIDNKLKRTGDGSFHYLSGLIGVLSAETSFNISRNVKQALPKLKDLGDQSAHSRRYIAKKQDLDDLRRDLRITIEELVQLTTF